MVLAAAAALGTTPHRCVVVGDIGRDMVAAGAAGATGVLVPTAVTRPEEVAAAPAGAGDLPGAVDLILRRLRLVAGDPGRTREGRPRRVLAVRSDAAGDVLLTGPAIRALRAGADAVTLLCGPSGRAAAELLPGVDEIVEWRLPWIDPEPEPVHPDAIERLAQRLAAVGADEAVVFTSFHQSPLPLALVLRLAGVPRISAISDDYAGSLLDVRHRVPAGVPEVERALSLAAAAGFPLSPGDDTTLRLRGPWPFRPDLPPDCAVVHPGASVPARACPPDTCRDIVEALAGAGCVVVGNTGPAHLAAAVGTPVVSLFAPTVPFGQWQPYGVPVVRLGDPVRPCRHTQAREGPVPGHPCLSTVDPKTVVDAVRLLGGRP
jgi:ADP-heptose:LPS heptosyltransferase